MKRWVPTFYAKKLTSIPASFFLHHGISYLLCDLDNTLAAYDAISPTQEIAAWVKMILEAGIHMTLISNNTKERVSRFAHHFGVDFLAQTGKPFSGKLLNFLMKKGYSKDKVMLIGDQLLTDVWVANRLGLKSLFVERLVPYDHWPTKPNRLLEHYLKKRLKKRGQLHAWEDHQ